jgi:hypothetical protein
VRVGSHLGDFPCEVDANGQKSITAVNCDHAEIDFKTTNEAGLISEDWHSVFVKLAGASSAPFRSLVLSRTGHHTVTPAN